MAIRRDEERVRWERASWAVALSHRLAEHAHHLKNTVMDIRLKLYRVSSTENLSDEGKELLARAGSAAKSLTSIAVDEATPTLGDVLATVSGQWPSVTWDVRIGRELEGRVFAGLLVKALAQLLANSGAAIAATGRPGIVIIDADKNGPFLKLSVTTHGIGFPDAITHDIFHKPIVRGAQAGFGLYLVGAWIVDGLGGTVTLTDNDEGSRSRVDAVVPLARAVIGEDEEEEERHVEENRMQTASVGGR
jgi:signal transduction histidine kinase